MEPDPLLDWTIAENRPSEMYAMPFKDYGNCGIIIGN
jgi:hypothetical protein